MSGDRDRATRLLINYLEAIATKAGMRWDGDYNVEIGEAVDAIIAASVEASLKAVRQEIRATGSGGLP